MAKPLLPFGSVEDARFRYVLSEKMAGDKISITLIVLF